MSFQVAVATMSLGCAATHSIDQKLMQAAIHGLEGIEVFYEDLQQLAKSFAGGGTPENEIAAARYIHSLCNRYSLKVISLQPLWVEEGTFDPSVHQAKIEHTKHMLQLASELGTEMILVPSSVAHPSSALSSDPSKIADHLRCIVDTGAASHPQIRFAYEALAFGTHINTWEASWSIVKLVDRPNFGICLDTFNIAGRIFADPASTSGLTAKAETELRQSLEDLVHTINVAKVFLVQVVDAQKLRSPLVKGHSLYNADQPARMSWSRNCRLFYGETNLGAYLPIREVANAIFNRLGYKGWVSMELFNASTKKGDEHIPAQHAARAMTSWVKLAKDCKLFSNADLVTNANTKHKSVDGYATTRRLNPDIDFRSGKLSDFQPLRPSAISYGSVEPFSPAEQRIWLFIGLSAFVGVLGSFQLLIKALIM